MRERTVKLTVFRPDGEFRCRASYSTKEVTSQGVKSELQHRLRTGTLPGLQGSSWLVVAELPEHSHSTPLLVWR